MYFLQENIGAVTDLETQPLERGSIYFANAQKLLRPG